MELELDTETEMSTSQSERKFRDRLRIAIILYTFSEPLSPQQGDRIAVFRTEIRIQAIDFLLRYPDFFAHELINLLNEGALIDENEVRLTVKTIFSDREPELRVEEMEKFFHGAYESIDDVIAYLMSIDFIQYESKKRTDGKEYDKLYFLTTYGSNKIEQNLKQIPAVNWYFERCRLIKHYLGSLSGSELKTRQYRFVDEYATIAYKSKISQLHKKVEDAFRTRFKEELV